MGRKSEVLQNQAMRVYVGNDSSETNRRLTRKPIEPELPEDDSQEEVKVSKITRRSPKKQLEPNEVLPKVSISGKRRSRQTQNESPSSDVEVESDKKSSPPKKSKKSGSYDEGKDKEEKSVNDDDDDDDDEAGDNEEENTTNGDDQDSKDTSKENYEVDKLVSSRVRNGKTQYKVHWKGYSSNQDTWENESNLSCDELIEQYLSSQKKKKAPGVMQQNGEWEVLKIVDMHIFKTGKRMFLVRWKGFGPKDDTWEPEDNLKHTNLLNRYLAKLEEVKSIPLRDLRIKRQKTDRFTYMPQGGNRRESKRHRNKQRIHYYDD